jgi:hypothetical protein
MLAYPDETTLYKEGTFLPQPSVGDFELLMRRPDLFALAGSRITGARAAVVERLANGLSVKAATVPVVRALFRVFKALPEFARNTKRLPQTALALRDTFAKAKSPEQFLFVLLPSALGLQAISDTKANLDSIEIFFNALNEALGHLVQVTPTTINNARDVLLGACGFDGGEMNWTRLRQLALALEPVVTESRLLTFLRRVIQGDADASGVESVLAVVANRPPNAWSDVDVERFPEVSAALGRALREASRSAGISPPSDAVAVKLSRKERRQAEDLQTHLRQYIQRTARNIPRRVVHVAVANLMGEITNG